MFRAQDGTKDFPVLGLGRTAMFGRPDPKATDNLVFKTADCKSRHDPSHVLSLLRLTAYISFSSL